LSGQDVLAAAPLILSPPLLKNPRRITITSDTYSIDAIKEAGTNKLGEEK